MIIPTVIPIVEDELLSSWLERLAAVNNIPTLQFLEYFLGIVCAWNKNRKRLRTIGGIAKIVSHPSLTGMSPANLLVKHTPAPVDSLFMDLYSSSMYIESLISASDLTWINGFPYLFPEQPRYCPLCAADDSRLYGTPVVHVSHQYLSVTTCWKHGVSLTDNPKEVKEVQASAPEEIKTAVFMHKLYDRGFLGYINTIKHACLCDSAKHKISMMAKSDKLKNALDFAEIATVKEFYRMLLSTTQRSTYRVKLERFIAQIFEPDDLMQHFQPESLRSIQSECNKSLDTIGNSLSSIDYPFITAICGECHREYISYHHTVRIGGGCPYCSSISVNKVEAERMFEAIAKRDGFLVIGNGYGCKKEMQHRCGKTIHMKPQYVLRKGHLACPDCDGDVAPDRSTKLVKAFERIGERKTMNCGMEAVIIAYRNATSIDVRFENGFVKQDVEYSAFLKGNILPNITMAVRKSDEYVGKKKKMLCGLVAEIIGYCGPGYVDVRFDNGIIHRNVRISHFYAGKLSLSNAEKWINIKKKMNCGVEATIIDYHNAKDIVILFADGEIRSGVYLSSFKAGKLKPKSLSGKVMWEGQKRHMKCGLDATIIKYYSYKDITVRLSDGTICKHTDIDKFTRGTIAPQVAEKGNREGETNKMTCGQDAKIIKYRNAEDLDIQFEDGTIRNHVSYHNFKIGTIRPIPRSKHAEIRIGERHVMNCGLEAEIVKYRNSTDIDIRFEDGSLRKHKCYSAFKKGQISLIPRRNYAVLRIGETSKMTCGQNAKILEYRNARDIDIQFENGTVRKHVSYYNFKTGKLRPVSAN